MRILQSVVGIVAALAVFPAVASARSIELPSDAVGISEATYYKLKNQQCYFKRAPSRAVRSENGVLCDPLVARLAGKVVFRADFYGQMYQVNDKRDMNTLTRYLPDGFYRADGKLYWVANGLRTTLPTDSAYKRVRRTANNAPAMVTYAESATITTEQQNALRGRIVVLVDLAGQLAYVPDPDSSADLPILSKANQSRWKRLLGDEIIRVQPALIEKLPVNDSWKQ